jgi:predicted CxxxxCH...CXXCH cytochrome family protein
MIGIGIMILAAGCSDPKSSVFNPDTGKHRADWLPSAHMTAAITDLAPCADCHGQDFLGGISKTPCGSCHMGGPTSMHPSDWLRDACFNHGVYALNNGTSGCSNGYCHGANLAGVAESGPSCSSCHDPIPSADRCGSCHGIPPATGRHVVHASTPLNYLVCGSCHNAGCETHNNGANNIALPAVFTAKSAAAASYSGTTCAKISCHGGQTTPTWTSGTINVDTQCTSCHAQGTAEYNSFNSGEHDRHVNREGINCTQCHDPALVATNHFTALHTPAMEGPAWKTLYTSIQYDGTTCHQPCHDAANWWSSDD